MGIHQYPDPMQLALDLKADDADVVHLSGAETISGAKTFSVSPSVPSPSANNDAVNLITHRQTAYTFSSINIPAGTYVQINLGTIHDGISSSWATSALFGFLMGVIVVEGVSTQSVLIMLGGDNTPGNLSVVATGNSSYLALNSNSSVSGKISMYDDGHYNINIWAPSGGTGSFYLTWIR